MEVHMTSNSLQSRQPAVIFSLQNMQYIQWHLQETIKKRQIMNQEGKNKQKTVIFSAKTPAEEKTEPKHKQNRNSHYKMSSGVSTCL